MDSERIPNEHENGERAQDDICREAVFNAAFQWVWKLGATLAMTVSGTLLTFIGADIGNPDDMLGPEVVHRLRLAFSIVPALFSGVAMVLIWRYPLTAERIAEIKAQKEATGTAPPLTS
jgi:glycoside/pentoside/hexuronide:cation symporter, GPH family